MQKTVMALLIDENAVKELRKFGEANEISVEELSLILQKKAPCAGDRKGYVLFLPTRFRLVFSVEWSMTRDFKYKIRQRRMSISVLRRNANDEQEWISESALATLLQLLGFASLDSGELIIQAREDATLPHIAVTQELEKEPLPEALVNQFKRDLAHL